MQVGGERMENLPLISVHASYLLALGMFLIALAVHLVRGRMRRARNSAQPDFRKSSGMVLCSGRSSWGAAFLHSVLRSRGARGDGVNPDNKGGYSAAGSVIFDRHSACYSGSGFRDHGRQGESRGVARFAMEGLAESFRDRSTVCVCDVCFRDRSAFTWLSRNARRIGRRSGTGSRDHVPRRRRSVALAIMVVAAVLSPLSVRR